MKYVKLSEIATIVTGGTPSTGVKEYWENGNIPWLQSGVCQNCYVYEPSKYITLEGYNNSATKMMPADTILIALTGATAGKVGYLTFEACGNQSITGIALNDGYNPKFIYYFLMSKRSKILHDCVGGAQPHISQAYVKNILVPKISYEQQSLIVKVLDNLNSIKDCRLHSIELLDELVKSRFNEMFGDIEDNPYKFPTKTLNDVCSSIVRGPFGSSLKKDMFVKKGENTYKVYEQKHAINKSASIGEYYIDQDKFNDLKRFECKPGDFLMSCSGTMGKLYQLPAEIERGIINQALCKFTLNDLINPLFFNQIMTLAVDEIETKGSGIQNIASVKYLKELKLILPPIKLQNEFADFVKTIDEAKLEVERQIALTEELLDKKMNEYFGECDS